MVQPKNYWYVASPYSARGLEGERAKALREKRYRAAMRFVAWALEQKMIVLSSIVHCHELASIYELPKGHEFWLEYDKAMVLGGGGVIVLCIDGWQESFGVRGEVALAHASGCPVLYAIEDPVEDYILRADAPK
jgi:hypothetical protein